ncbi:MAG: leucine-rich repeat domain-containing protein [Limisphaerales bacterium]
MKTSWPLLLVLLLLATPAAMQGQLQYTNADGSVYTYSINADGSATIVAYSGPPWAVTIPNNINGLPVTSIGEDAFVFRTSLTSVCFAGNAPGADSTVFEDDNHATVYCFPCTTGWSNTFAGLPVVPWSPTVFNYTTNAGAVTITGYTGPGGPVVIPPCINNLPVTSIGDNAFLCPYSPTSITIPNSVTSIGDGAFMNCCLLASITIPASVTNIGVVAFAQCYSLTAITVDAGNPVYSGVNGVLFDESQTALLDYPDGLGGSYTIPDGVTSIGDGAFDNASLTSVTIPNSVTSIGNGVFAECYSLASATIPNGLTNIGIDAFAECYSLTSITIPKGLTSIPDGAFFYCYALTNITIPDSVTSIGSGAFYICENLGSVTIGNNVTSIGDTAFRGTALTRVTIPGSVNSIGDQAFSECPSLTSVYFQGSAPTADSTVFGDDSATVYYLPGTTGWSNSFAGLPTALWFLPNPMILNNGPGFGVQSNGFGFTISWATNTSVVVEACTDLASPVWIPLTNVTLTNGSFYFSDPQWSNCPTRFYRINSH